MNRQTDVGVATVRRICSVFELSRAAYYAAQKRPGPKVVRLPRRPSHAPAEIVLDAIRRIVEAERAWAFEKFGPRFAETRPHGYLL